MEDSRIFLTDYASYNNGTQFEFGHWVDLSDFNGASDLMGYIIDHFKECDGKSPLDSPREEIMITDFEGFPEALYSEAMSLKDFERLYSLIDFCTDNDIKNLDNEDDNLLSLWSEFCQENRYDDEIYNFDDDTLEMLLGNDVMKAFQAGLSAEINWSDNYLTIDGYGHIKSVYDPSTEIDETVLIDWILETKIQ